MTQAEIGDRLLGFSVRIGKVVDALPETRLGRHIASQLIRCGTASGPNYEEACAGESRADFVHKLHIALKELREARYWLGLITKAGLLPKQRLADLADEATQLCNILGKSFVTAKRRSDRQS